MTDLHEASFTWPAGPSKVIVTGSFDNWSKFTELTKNDDGFTGTFHLPWGSKVTYKYIVDGQWRTSPSAPTEADGAGNINNVYTSPPKPAASSAPVAEKTSMEEVKDNAASIVSYMASGLGAAFASVTGIDPINPQQIPVEDDKAQEILAEAKSVPAPDATKAEPAPAPTVATAHNPHVPEPPVEAEKPIADALAPIIDEPVVLNLLPTSTSTISQAATTVAEKVIEVTTTVKEALPTSAEEVKAAVPTIISTTQATEILVEAKEALPSTTEVASKLPEPIANGVEKVQETVAPSTTDAGAAAGVPIPDAPEPYKEPVVTEPVPVKDAVEPYKETNGKLPGETETAAAPSKVAETAEKVKETVASSTDTAPATAAGAAGKASEAVEKVKETVTGKKSPPASPTKHSFPASRTSESSTAAGTTNGNGSTTPKRKKRQSIFGKLKEVFTPEKQKKAKSASSSS